MIFTTLVDSDDHELQGSDNRPVADTPVSIAFRPSLTEGYGQNLSQLPLSRRSYQVNQLDQPMIPGPFDRKNVPPHFLNTIRPRHRPYEVGLRALRRPKRSHLFRVSLARSYTLILPNSLSRIMSVVMHTTSSRSILEFSLCFGQGPVLKVPLTITRVNHLTLDHCMTHCVSIGFVSDLPVGRVMRRYCFLSDSATSINKANFPC
jgi:hypothetical protein